MATTLEFDAPQQLGRYLEFDSPSPQAKDTETGFIGKVRGAAESILEPAVTMLTGAAAAPLAGFAGMAGDVYSGLTGTARIGDAVASDVQSALTYRPRSQGGQENMQALAGALDASKLAGLPIAGGELPAIARAIQQQGPLLRTLPAAIANSPEAGAASAAIRALAPKRNTLNQEAFETLKRAREAGAVVPPSSVNPTFMNRLAESIPGKTAVAQEASNINQTRFVEPLARRAIGLPEGTPLTAEATRAVRTKAYQQGYLPVAQIGEVATDANFGAALDSIGAKYTGAASSFPAAVRNDVRNLVESLKVPKFQSADALQMSQILRDEASAAYRAGDAEIGAAKRAASRAIEDQIERSLASGGKASGQILQGFRDARELMAKSHSVENAIREGTGTIDARALARQLQSGEPLSGDLATIARFANTFEKANQRPGQVAGPGVHNLRTLSGAGVGGGVGAVVGGPLGAAVGGAASVVIPPAIREYLLSAGVQERLLRRVAPNAKAAAQGVDLIGATVESRPLPYLKDAPPLLPNSWREPMQPVTQFGALPVLSEDLLPIAERYAGTNIPIGTVEAGGPVTTRTPLPTLPPTERGLLSLADDQPRGRLSDIGKSIDFKTRLEVMSAPEMKAATAAFIEEHGTIKRALAAETNSFRRGALEAKLRGTERRFMADLKQMGIRNEDEARNLMRKVYETGGETQRGITKTMSLKDLMNQGRQ